MINFVTEKDESGGISSEEDATYLVNEMRGIEEDLQKIEIKVCKFSVDVNSATQYIHDTISNQEELVEKLIQLDY